MTGPAPLWLSIAATLRGEIAAGAYHAGDRLPTEAELARRFGVNRHTVRHALAELSRAGEVRSRRGAGVFVASPPADYPLGERVRFHQNLLASGRTPSRRFLRMETRAATEAEAMALGLAPGAPVHLVEGLSLADEEPVALFRSTFPAEALPGLLEALAETASVTEALRRAGVEDYTRAWTRVSAEAADPVAALHLRLPPSAPVLRTVALNRDAAGRAVEHGITLFAGERVTLTIGAHG